MFQKIIHRLIRPRHYWRDIGFDELSELYTTLTFRNIAMSLVGIFIPIYLYKLDYAVWQIFWFYTLFYILWAISCFGVAYIIARVGPKHTMLASNVFLVIAMLMLVSQGDLRWPLSMLALMLAIGNSMFFTAFHVDFSKVKHKEHGGKEVGWSYSMEKVGGILGPLIGGVVAAIFGAEYIFMIAIILLFIGLMPLFFTGEPTTTNQNISFRRLNPRVIKYDLASFAFLSVENIISAIVWPLFISIYVFSDDPYIKLGTITSLSVLVALFIARAIGRTIDKRKGRSLLRLGASLNSGLHLFRPFTTTYFGALGINLVNEAVTPAYRMPAFKGLYDAADGLPGNRIVYITLLEVNGKALSALVFGFTALAAFYYENEKNIFTALFIVGAIASLGIILERYRALDP